jgi:hypothetical protein
MNMTYLLAAILATVGMGILIWNKLLSEKLGSFYSRRFSVTFGKLAHVLGWDDPTTAFNKFIYRGFVITVGIILLVFGITAFFRPIDTSSAVEQTNSLLQN